MQLFKEHLGLLDNTDDSVVMDPLLDEFYHHVWNKTAKENTETYRSVFRPVPDDTGKEAGGNERSLSMDGEMLIHLQVPTFESHRKFVPNPRIVPTGHVADPMRMTEQQICERLKGIRGHLVTFPTQYLCFENMTASIVQEALPPTVFT